MSSFTAASPSAPSPSKHTLLVTSTVDEAAVLCAEMVAEALRTLVSERKADGQGPVTVAFSGGTTPARMFGHLAGRITRDAIANDPWWSSVAVLQVDERIAPDGDSARNANDLTNCLLNPTNTDMARRHLMPVDDPDAARSYATTVAQLAPNGIDVVVLGLGDDGHTASLVPGDAVVEERGALVAQTGLYKGHRRLTLTRGALDQAHLVFWLVTGAGKTKALSRLMTHDRTIPAGLIDAANQTVIADDDAAAKVHPAHITRA
jgi:6-phosphogluconolactonase